MHLKIAGHTGAVGCEDIDFVNLFVPICESKRTYIALSYCKVMKERMIGAPTPDDFVSGEFGRHLLKAYKDLFAVASIPHRHVKRGI